MKKTKIIIPALALIAFSVAASVTGTVAWFTTRRTASINAGSYTVVKTSANLDVVVGAGHGTRVVSNVVTLEENVGTEQDPSWQDVLLTDGSFNHSTGKIYQPNEFGDAWHPDYPEVSYNDGSLATKLLRGTYSYMDNAVEKHKNIYTAVEFTLTFTVLFGSDAGDYGLFIDNSVDSTNPQSPVEHTNFKAYAPNGNTPLSGSDIKTAKGFRMGFYSTTATYGKSTVLADLNQAKSNDTVVLTHVNNSSGTFQNATAYTEPYIIGSEYAAAMPAAGTLEKADAEDRPDYIGYFPFSANGTAQLTYTVVCWFEGTDPNVVNQANAADYQKVVSELHFEAIKLAD